MQNRSPLQCFIVEAASNVALSDSMAVYLGVHPRSVFAFVVSMTEGWLIVSIHWAPEGRYGSLATARAAAATGAWGTRTARNPSALATSTPVTTSSAAML